MAPFSDTHDVAEQDGQSDDEARQTQITVAWIGVVGLVLAAVVAAFLTGGFGLLTGDKPTAPKPTTAIASGGSSANADTCVNGGVVVQANVNCTMTSTGLAQPTATTADAGCGSFGGAPSGLSLRLKVVMWCAPEAVRGQYEYKLKVAVTNTGTNRLNIGLGHFVLLWRTLNPSRWSPPPGGAPAPPHRIRYLDRDYWAISANLEGAAEPLPDGQSVTFETHWHQTSLAPGQTSLRPRMDAHKLTYLDPAGTLETIRFNYHEDDLVFYVPVQAVNRDRNFLGLAYKDGDSIIAICPQPRWGPRVPPSAF